MMLAPVTTLVLTRVLTLVTATDVTSCAATGPGSAAGGAADGAAGGAEGGAASDAVTGGFSMKAPDFAGVGSFVRFSSDLDTFYAIHNFNDDLKLRFLPLCLSGVARDASKPFRQRAGAPINRRWKGCPKALGRPTHLTPTQS